MRKLIVAFACLTCGSYAKRPEGNGNARIGSVARLHSQLLATTPEKTLADLTSLLFATSPDLIRNRPTSVHGLPHLVPQAVSRKTARRLGCFMESATDVPFPRQVGEVSRKLVSDAAKLLVKRPEDDKEDDNIAKVVKKFKADVNSLDGFAEQKPKRSNTEIGLLGCAMFGSIVSPVFLPHVLVEYLVPALSFLPLVVAAQSEYVGKMAVSRGREISAVTLRAAAESEILFSQAEREKAIIGLCVGISATAAALSLVWPDYVEDLVEYGVSESVTTQFILLPPLVSGLFAAVASLASEVTANLANQAENVGARRFASSEEVRRTWLSAPQQIVKATDRTQSKWYIFFLSVLPAPLIALAFPGEIAGKAIVCSAVAAAQAALGLATAEYALSEAAKSVAEKSRTAAVSETYARQGISAGASLPYVTALAGLCAAVTVGLVEVLPAVPTVFGEVVVAALFPTLGVLCASTASGLKNCCEIDAKAAAFASTSLAETDIRLDGDDRNPLEQSRYYIRKNLRRVWEYMKRR